MTVKIWMIPSLDGSADVQETMRDHVSLSDIARAALEPHLPKGIRASVYPINKAAYRRRNLIERAFGLLKNRRRIANAIRPPRINLKAAIPLLRLQRNGLTAPPVWSV